MRIIQDADCSGRMLATILIAWVTTAMIASILLQWEHTWIVLVVLTLLFFMVCGYTVYTVKRTHARILIEQQRTAIRTISGIAANRRQAESLGFTVRTLPDLPPSYASVVTVPRTSVQIPPVQISGTNDPPSENKFEDPPPYYIAIASINMQERNPEVNEQHAPPVATPKKDDAVASATSGLASASHTCPHPR